MMKQISKNGLVKNTLILIIGNMFIKILALLNRIILTRLLGNEGISLYMITLPSVMLFISLGSLSLNIAVTKIVAQKRNAGIINKALKIALISSAIVSIIMLIIAKPLAYDWLKQPKIFYPIILAAPLILLSAINSVLRGYYNGIKKVNITTTSILIEQIFRIALAAVMIYIFIDKGIVIAVSISIVAMSFGEIASIVYTSLMLRKYKQEKKNDCTYKEILDAALPITATRLFGNVTYFLEPIIFTLSLTILNYDSNNILYLYSETTAYSIPLITMFSFISYALASAIIPYVASADKKQIANYISKSIFYSLLTAIPITIILIIYAKQFMYLIYNTTIGSENVTKYCIFFIFYYIMRFNTSIFSNYDIIFIFYYIQAPLVSIM